MKSRETIEAERDAIAPEHYQSRANRGNLEDFLEVLNIGEG
jgi:hypothetical protein